MIRRPFGTRVEIVNENITDHKLPYSPKSLSIVLRDWEIMSKSYDEFAVKIFTKFLNDYPGYRSLFTGLDDVEDNELENNKIFMDHSLAIMNCITLILRSLTGEYEDGGELLPLIGESHRKRRVTLAMFNGLKESLLDICFEDLKSDKKSRAAWTEMINFIFDNYICVSYKQSITE